MDSAIGQLERRAAQRFPFHIPVAIKLADSELEMCGFTQDISARGAFLYTDSRLVEGANVELTLDMPSEITLAETMRVRCKGKILRVVSSTAGEKLGVAVYLEGYEYLTNSVDIQSSEGCFGRISSLHSSALSSPEKTSKPAIIRAINTH